MTPLFTQIQEAVTAIDQRWTGRPRIGVILGTGLGDLARGIDTEAMIKYEDIPHFPRSTVQSHAGQLVCGNLAGKQIVAMEGRFHFYEGYNLRQVTFPVRVMKALGCEILIVSNAAGGLNPQFSKGDVMLIEDHINLLADNPLIGPNDERLGVRFPDMSEPYSKELMQLAKETAREERIPLQQGVYVAVAGPNLETRAEYRFLRTIGADVVGMSTVPEVIVAVHSRMKVLGFSAVTDMCLPDNLKSVSVEEIIAVANDAGAKMSKIIAGVVRKLA